MPEHIVNFLPYKRKRPPKKAKVKKDEPPKKRPRVILRKRKDRLMEGKRLLMIEFDSCEECPYNIKQKAKTGTKMVRVCSQFGDGKTRAIKLKKGEKVPEWCPLPIAEFIRRYGIPV